VVGILQRYVLREMIRVFVLSVCALTGIIFLGFTVSLLHAGLNVIQLRPFVPYLLLHSLPYAVPTGLLIAAVLTFGRLSGDNEITAMRCSGVHLWTVVQPVAGFAVLASLGSLVLNLEVLPWAYRRMRESRNAMIQPYLDRVGRTRTKIKMGPYEIHVAGTVPENPGMWRNVAVIHYVARAVQRVMLAETGFCTLDDQTQTATVVLRRVHTFRPELGSGRSRQEGYMEELTVPIDLSARTRARLRRPKYKSLVLLLADRNACRARLSGHAPASRPRFSRRRLQGEYRGRSRTLEALNQQTDECGKEASKAEEETQTLAALVSAAVARRDQATRDCQEAEDEFARAAVGVRELKQRIDETPDEERGKLIALLATREKETAGLRKRRAKARKALQDATRSHTALRADWTRKTATLAQTQSALADLKRRRDALDGQLRRLKDRMDILEVQEDLGKIETEIHSRLAGGFACLVFVLIGLPLGVMVRRGNVVVAFAVSFGVVLALYYPLLITAETMAEDNVLPAAAALWSPNLIVGSIGALLLRPVLRR